jgi:hypothetical protein
MSTNIEKVLKARLSELRMHLAKVDRELHKPLAADSEDQAIELENQEALEVIGKTETTEILQIEAALKRISEGTNDIILQQADLQRFPAILNLDRHCRALPGNPSFSEDDGWGVKLA